MKHSTPTKTTVRRRSSTLTEGMFGGGARGKTVFDTSKITPATSTAQQIDQGGVSAMTMTTLLATIINSYQTKTNLLIYGKPGMGKTEGIIKGTKTLANRMPVGGTSPTYELETQGSTRIRPHHFPRGGNRLWIDISDFDAKQMRHVKEHNDVYFVFHTLKASKLDKYSFLGIPNADLSRESGMVVELQKAWIDLMSDVNTVGMVFLDEINHAELSVVQQLYSLFDVNRQAGDIKISDKVFLAGAGNPVVRGSGSSALPRALQGRFGTTAELIVTPQEWFEWAETEGNIHPIVTTFVKTNPDKLFYFAPEKGKEEIQVTPRSLEKLSTEIWSLDKEWRAFQLDMREGIPVSDTTWVQNKRVTKTGEVLTFPEALVELVVKYSTHKDWYNDFYFFVQESVSASWSDIVTDPDKYAIRGEAKGDNSSPIQQQTRKSIVQLKVAEQILATGKNILALNKGSLQAQVGSSHPEESISNIDIIPKEFRDQVSTAFTKKGPILTAAIAKIFRDIKTSYPNIQLPPAVEFIKGASSSVVVDTIVDYPENIHDNLRNIAWVLYKYLHSGFGKEPVADIIGRVVRSKASGKQAFEAVLTGMEEIPWAEAKYRHELTAAIRRLINIVNASASGEHNTRAIQDDLDKSITALASAKVDKPAAGIDEVEEDPPAIPLKRDPQQSKEAGARAIERGRELGQLYKQGGVPKPEVVWGTTNSLTYPPDVKGAAADEGMTFKYGDEVWQKVGPDDTDWKQL